MSEEASAPQANASPQATESTETATPAAEATPAAKAADSLADRKARLKDWGRDKAAPKDASDPADAQANASPNAPVAAVDASTAKDAPASGSPAEAEKPKEEKPKEDGRDLITKLAKERRAWELEKQSFQKERDAHKADLDLVANYKTLPSLREAKDHRGIMQLVYGDEWREAWFELTSSIAPEPVEPLTAEQAREIARKEHEQLIEAERKRAKDEAAARAKHGYEVYTKRLEDIAALGKHPSVIARGSLKDEVRLNKILTDHLNKTGEIPDPQVVIDTVETEDRAYFLKHLPYVASAIQAQSAQQTQQTSQPTKTLTPEMKQGALPPTDPPAPRNARESLEDRKKRLRALQQQAQ
jgi:hypothetical protein